MKSSRIITFIIAVTLVLAAFAPAFSWNQPPTGSSSSSSSSSSGGGANSFLSIPTGYTGPTIRASLNNSLAPVIMHPSSGTGTATMTFNAASQGNCQVGDEIFFFLQKSTGTIVNASGTRIDQTSFSNAQADVWHQTQTASTAIVFTDTGNSIWNGIAICVIPGARGGPALVDQHVLQPAASQSSYNFLGNSTNQLLGTHLQELHLMQVVQTCAASCAANNQIFNAPLYSDATGANLGEMWSILPIVVNDSNNGGGQGIWGTYRKDEAKEPIWNFSFVGATGGGASNDQIAALVVY